MRMTIRALRDSDGTTNAYGRPGAAVRRRRHASPGGARRSGGRRAVRPASLGGRPSTARPGALPVVRFARVASHGGATRTACRPQGSASANGRLLRRPRLLIVGCGDVGMRVLRKLAPRLADGRLAVHAVTRDESRQSVARALGAQTLALDLDARQAPSRLAGLARRAVYLAPTPPDGEDDPRLGRVIAACASSCSATGKPARWAWVGSTGVYGDCQGLEVDETHTIAPTTKRARRRAAAELRLRAAARRGALYATILRAPGIYGQDRLPVERLRQGLPALSPADDTYTNHIHADDLASICWIALFRGRPGRVVNAVDNTRLKMGDWFDRVADTFALPRPERLQRELLAGRVSPQMLSFMNESRLLSNRRLLRELRVQLRWPTVDAALAAVLESRRRSTGRPLDQFANTDSAPTDAESRS